MPQFLPTIEWDERLCGVHVSFFFADECVLMWWSDDRTFSAHGYRIQYSFISNRQVGLRTMRFLSQRNLWVFDDAVHLLIHNNNFTYFPFQHEATRTQTLIAIMIFILLLHVFGKARTSNAFMLSCNVWNRFWWNEFRTIIILFSRRNGIFVPHVCLMA